MMLTRIPTKRSVQERPLRIVALLLCSSFILGGIASADELDDSIPRHPLELRALNEPEAVLEALPNELSAAKVADDQRSVALLYLAEANACRVMADWLCQRRAGADAAAAGALASDPLLVARGNILESRAVIALQDYNLGEELLAEAQSQLKLSPSPALEADIQLGFSSLSHSLGKHKLAVTYAEAGLKLLGDDIAPGIQARLHRNRARALAQLGDSTTAQIALEAGIQAAQQVDDPKLVAELHLESARLAYRVGDIAAQQSHTAAVLALAEKLSNSQLFGQAHEALGLAAAQEKDVQGALREFMTATESFRELGLERDELRASQALIGLMLDVRSDSARLDPLLRRQFELQAKVALRDRAQASDDFESQLQYAQQQLEVLRLQSEAQLAGERSKAFEAQTRLNHWVNGLSLVTVLILTIFVAYQVRAKRRVLRVLAQLRRSESRAGELLRLSSGLVLLHDLEGRIDLLTPAAAKALGLEDIVDRFGKLRDHVAASDADLLELYLTTLRRSGEASEIIHIEERDGTSRVLRLDGRVAPNSADRPYVIGNATDITEEVREAGALRKQVRIDPLTGCFNRRYLEDFAAAASTNDVWAVINLDLDGFKKVNDTHGHDHGDAVLRDIAKFLNQRVREHDAVVRVGGDEFLILLPDASITSLTALLARLEADQDAAPCRYSLGSALRQPTETLAECMVRADTDMYERRRVARSKNG